tara:strand:+ start:215 stop:538 length:324 start_codon:yes stop_codon:yes gene_type:complete
MGNSNEIVAKYITEEERKQMFYDLVGEKLYRIGDKRSRKKVLLEYYYKNIEIYRNENSELQSHHKLNDLNKFLNYDTYELVRDTTYIGKTYKIAIINYIYKWYSNSK